MHALTADLQALLRRGWEYDRIHGFTDVLQRDTPDEEGAYITVAVYDRDDTASIRMAIAACLVADGHDLVRLLNEAYQALPEDATALRERILLALMGTDTPPAVCAGAGQPTGPASPEAGAGEPKTPAPAGDCPSPPPSRHGPFGWDICRTCGQEWADHVTGEAA